MQNKQVAQRELLTKRQLSQFTPAPMRFFTRNTEHKLTTTNVFELAKFINYIAADNYLPAWITETHIISKGDALGRAMAILVHQVNNN